MSTRWMNSLGTMLALMAGGSTRDTPWGEKAPGEYEELSTRSPPAVAVAVAVAVKGCDDGDGASPVPTPPLLDRFRTHGCVDRAIRGVTQV